MRIVNPSGEDARPDLSLAPRLKSLDGATIAVIDNRKHNAELLLHELERLLQERYKISGFEFYRKPHSSVPIPSDIFERLVARCNAVIHGVAD